MKTRSDFVSNSSSCSFIVESAANDGVVKAFGAFASVLAGVDIPYNLSDSVRISARAKNKWFKELSEAITEEPSDFKMEYRDWSSHKMVPKDPEDVGWDSIQLDLERITEIGKDPAYKDYLARLDSVSFTTEDSNTSGLMYLRMLYLFLERMGCCPSAAESEHSFLDDNDDFVTRLCSAGGGGEKDDLARFRKPAGGKAETEKKT